MIILFIGTVWLIKSHALNLSNQPPSSKQDRGDFLPKNSSFGSETNYDITLTMNSEGIFNVTSTSYIKIYLMINGMSWYSILSLIFSPKKIHQL